MKTDLGHLSKNKETYYLIAVCLTQYNQIYENTRSTYVSNVERIKREMEILEKRCQVYRSKLFSKSRHIIINIVCSIRYAADVREYDLCSHSESLECMKKFQSPTTPAENNSTEPSYETADIRIRNQTPKQPIFAVGRLQNDKPSQIKLKEFVKSEFEETDVGPSRFSWHVSNIPAMDAIRTKIKLLEYKIIQSFKTSTVLLDDLKGKAQKLQKRLIFLDW